jgi:hypothetical protein
LKEEKQAEGAKQQGQRTLSTEKATARDKFHSTILM